MLQTERINWGRVDGKTVHLFRLRNESGMEICVSDYGCILQSWTAAKPGGERIDFVLGYDTLQEYIDSETFFGAAVGPVADRIEGGKCEISGRTVSLPCNAGPDCMHSGPNGFHSRLWNGEILENGIAFSYTYSEAENPLPGCLAVTVRYLLQDDHTLRIEYAARCSCETLLSLTNHSYFTLSGGSTDCRGDVLTVHADYYAETRRDVDPICTGRMLCVDATPLDLRAGKKLGEVLAAEDFPEILSAGGLDHYFVVRGEGMREHARLYSPANGVGLACISDAPGVLVYAANGLDGEKGKNGRLYGRNYALCMETERFPNAAALPDRRPQAIVPAGELFTSSTEYRLFFD